MAKEESAAAGAIMLRYADAKHMAMAAGHGATTGDALLLLRAMMRDGTRARAAGGQRGRHRRRYKIRQALAPGTLCMLRERRRRRYRRR